MSHNLATYQMVTGRTTGTEHCLKEILIENTQIFVFREMYSGLSMVNDETYGNISLGSLYQIASHHSQLGQHWELTLSLDN